jgi:hypothetical protein
MASPNGGVNLPTFLKKNPSRRRSSGDSHHGSTKHHQPNMHEIEPPIDTVMWSLALPWPNSPADHFSPFGTPRRNFSGQLLKSPLSNSSSSIAAQRPPHRRTETLPAGSSFIKLIFQIFIK